MTSSFGMPVTSKLSASGADWDHDGRSESQLQPTSTVSWTLMSWVPSVAKTYAEKVCAPLSLFLEGVVGWQVRSRIA